MLRSTWAIGAVLGGAVIAASCGGNVVVDRQGATSGVGGTGGATAGSWVVASSSTVASSGGACPGLVDCGGVCTNVEVDPQNCGTCGHDCGSGVCSQGVCQAPACCGENVNDFPPVDSCNHGVTWLAWQYVPACSFTANRIEIHSNAGSVALLADAGGKPGATLFEGALSPSTQAGWLGATVTPPVPITSGQTYWIGEATETCSIASQGTEQQPYYGGGSLAGPWDGPYTQYFWTAHVESTCM